MADDAERPKFIVSTTTMASFRKLMGHLVWVRSSELLRGLPILYASSRWMLDPDFQARSVEGADSPTISRPVNISNGIARVGTSFTECCGAKLHRAPPSAPIGRP